MVKRARRSSPHVVSRPSGPGQSVCEWPAVSRMSVRMKRVTSGRPRAREMPDRNQEECLGRRDWSPTGGVGCTSSLQSSRQSTKSASCSSRRRSKESMFPDEVATALRGVAEPSATSWRVGHISVRLTRHGPVGSLSDFSHLFAAHTGVPSTFTYWFFSPLR